jgi:hypothetical protein
MVKSGRAQMVVVLAIGAVVGYAAASSRFNAFPNADAGPSQQRVSETPAGSALCASLGSPLRDIQKPAVENTGRRIQAASGTCCTQGAAKARLVAMANIAKAQDQPASGKKPNIIFIMGDDIGWFNIGAYHQGIMAGRTPNLDRLAAQGMRFTDYYAEASCTAGRANFITGELPIRTGLTTVGQAGAAIGMPDAAPTIATALKSMGYATGQFGKNHLGDRNEFLPTVHGFDVFFGNLYHLNAQEEPENPDYP